MNDKDKFSITFRPGTFTGAIAVGTGATAKGSVTVGGPEERAAKRWGCVLDIQGATSREDLVEGLESALEVIRCGKDTFGPVTIGENARGVAWKIEAR